jgi:hypothetical protein
MNITKQCNNYIAESIILVILVNLGCYFAMQLGGYDLLAAQIVGTLFVLVFEIASVLVWRWVALKHRNMLPSFFTAASGFRFLGALLVMTVWYLATGKENIVMFLVVFFVFYFVSLIHHSIFFSRMSKRL